MGFLLLNESGDGVDSVSDHGSSLAGGVILALGPGGGPLPQPLLLGVLGLGPVLVQQLEQLGGWKIVQNENTKVFFKNEIRKILDWYGGILPSNAVIALTWS